MDSYPPFLFYSLTPIDYVVFFFVTGLCVLAAIVGHRIDLQASQSAGESRAGQVTEWLLMGRRLTLPMFVATLVATWYGGILGVTQIAFEQGIYNFITQGVFWYTSYALFALFFVDRLREARVVSFPHWIETLYGTKARRLAGWLNVVQMLPLAAVSSLGILLQSLLGGPMWLACALGVLVVCAYTMWGGFRAVVYSDLVQAVVMYVAVIGLMVAAYATYGGLDFLQKSLPADHFSWSGHEGAGKTFLWGFIAMMTLVNPVFYQRVLAARSRSTAKRGILVAIAFWCLFDLCTTFGAMYARAVLPEAASSQAYLRFALELLPEGARGFFLAGIAATILSTLDSFLFQSASSLALDTGMGRSCQSQQSQRWSVLIIGFVSVVLVTAFSGNIYHIWLVLGSMSAGSLLVPTLAKLLFPRRWSQAHFLVSTTSSLILMGAWSVWPRSGAWAEVDALYVGLIVGLCCYLFLPSRYLSSHTWLNES